MSPLDPHSGKGAFSQYCEAPAGLVERFQAAGGKQRHFFPHRVYRIARPGPDGYKLAKRMLGNVGGGELRQIVLYALPEATAEFPREIFFDRDIQWHEQHCGRPGQVAWATVVVRRDRLIVTTLVSDLVQRISRRREHKTRVERVFKGWAHQLWNAVMDYAADLGVDVVQAPSAELVLSRMTDRSRSPQAALFERVYDETPRGLFRTEGGGRLLTIRVRENADRLAPLEKRSERVSEERTVAIVHDVERGLGHRDVDPEFARRADAESAAHLDRMLAIEEAAGVSTTYNVVGCMLGEVEEKIRGGEHAVAFHSFDHRVSRVPLNLLRPHGLRRLAGRAFGSHDREQLQRCREVDYRLKGYRPPRSRAESLSDATLSRYNFEWLASSPGSQGVTAPRLGEGVVRAPIHLDDFDLYRGVKDFSTWERQALETIRSQRFTAIGLHDCYGELWLDGYESFLEKVGLLARLRTVDEVASRTFLDAARWV